MLVATAGIISNFLTELTRLLTTAEAIMEVEVEEGEETEGVVFLMERALTNLSPKDSRSCMEGGSSLKNKLLCRGTEQTKVRSKLQDLLKCDSSLKYFACSITDKKNYCKFNKQLL